MSRNKRQRRQNGSLFRLCEKCKVEPDRCKGFCIFQKLEEIENRRKNDGDRI